MSAWRRIAIEEVPACKRIIEQAKDPATLWSELYRELEDSYCRPRDEEKIRQIYRFFLLCLRSPKYKTLNYVLEDFIRRLFQSAVIREDLPHRITESDFNQIENTMSYGYSEERFAQMRRDFFAAKHKPK